LLLSAGQGISPGRLASKLIWVMGVSVATLLIYEGEGY
jgi:hypothetical protein